MFAERVMQGSVSPGAATTINLTAPETGWRSFVGAFGTGQPCYYYIEDTATGAWELGSGSVTAGSPDTLTRTTVLRNSLGTTARIDFTGTVLVYNDLIAPTSVGRQLLLAADAAAARAALGATTTGSALVTAADAVAGRAAISAPPLPQTGAGAGQFVVIATAAGAAYSLPAGGTWAYFIVQIIGATNTFGANQGAGVAAGGTLLGTASSGNFYTGFAWRVG